MMDELGLLEHYSYQIFLISSLLYNILVLHLHNSLGYPDES